ncbi:hypothetical protein [Aeromonas veronii]|uniref:hypothetical protein n=1 Tax=Aeromonas veronii TaxID=654 RepID=UPI003F7A6ECB
MKFKWSTTCLSAAMLLIGLPVNAAPLKWDDALVSKIISKHMNTEMVCGLDKASDSQKKWTLNYSCTNSDAFHFVDVLIVKQEHLKDLRKGTTDEAFANHWLQSRIDNKCESYLGGGKKAKDFFLQSNHTDFAIVNYLVYRRTFDFQKCSLAFDSVSGLGL